ncbi:MAG: kelch repeat-containing protein [Phycisphaerae bacterium]|nr:kelch repeat-containing protein [Phycisphaerae bacterium]
MRSRFVGRTCALALLLVLSSATPSATCAGTWVAVATDAPVVNAGVAILLSDGAVLVLGNASPNRELGDTWHRLTPDSTGSYVNGTWSAIAPMLDTREYFSSQVLMDGRLYVAGGEYGTGKSKAEVYDPVMDTWTATPPPGGVVSDANSEMLPDGRVLQALVEGNLKKTRIYDPVTNTFVDGPQCLGIHNESVWMKLADDSILFVDRGTTAS